MDQFIYAVGGYDGSNQLSSVERYDIVSDQWTTVTSMNCARSALSVSVVNNSIYAVGKFLLAYQHCSFSCCITFVFSVDSAVDANTADLLD